MSSQYTAFKPIYPLDASCAVIHDNRLYTYSVEGFQSLSLKENATWFQEPMGISVEGAKCVKGGVDGDNSRPAFYVVGGSTNSSSIQYPGLQRFSINEKIWQNIAPISTVTVNRKHHGAAYITSSSSILIYGGSQNGDAGPSTQTFNIDTWPPYAVNAYNSPAPPVVDPTMLDWDYSHAAMVGGGAANVNVFKFSTDEGWTDAGVALPAPLPDSSAAGSVLLGLDDGSKVLETINFAASPNTVQRVIVLGPVGARAEYGRTVGDGSAALPSKSSQGVKRKRASLDNFPTYNSSLAPTISRTDALVVQNSGIVALIGGNKQQPLELFDQNDNRWINTTEYFYGEQAQLPLPTISSSSSTSSSTSMSRISTASSSGTHSASHSATAAPTATNHSNTGKILGGVFGALIAIIILLVLALLCLRNKKKEKREAEKRMSEYPVDKKISMGTKLSFEDAGMPFANAGAPTARGPVPSVDSMAIMSGKATHDRRPSTSHSVRSNRSDRSGRGERLGLGTSRGNRLDLGQSMGAMFAAKKSSPLAISRPVPQEQTELQERKFSDHRPLTSHQRTDEGFDTYFNGNNAVNLTGKRAAASASVSDYRGSYWPDPSAPVAPFQKPRSDVRASEGVKITRMNVPTGSPNLDNTTSHDVSQGLRAKISHGDSISTAISQDSSFDFNYDKIAAKYNSDQDNSQNSPVGNTWSGPPSRPLRPPSNNSIRPPSSNYHLSVGNGTYIGATEPWRESNESGAPPPRIPSFPMPNSIRPVTQWPKEPIPEVEASPYARENRPPQAKPSHARQNSHDYFGHNPKKSGGVNEDVSWLNLGAENR